MGAGRHGAVPRRSARRTGTDARRAAAGQGQGAGGDEDEQNFLLELDDARQRDRHDQGRRHDRFGQPAGGGDRSAIHQAGDAVVTNADLKS